MIGGLCIAGNQRVKIHGQFRSRNAPGENRMKLMLYFFATDIFGEKDEVPEEEANSVMLNGYLCKPPSYRITPKGRDITDLLLAVPRNTGHTDYIPCIAWGKNAMITRELTIGDRIRVNGRMQSRPYKKTDDRGIQREMTAYEVSVNAFDKGR